MTPAHLSAIRAVLGPMTSEAKCKAVFEAVLLSVDVPTIARVVGGVYDGYCDPDETPTNYARALSATRAAINALLAE